jgi:hypothetical protein
VLVVLLPPVLFFPLVVLRASFVLSGREDDRAFLVLGATMTSASGDILTKGCVLEGVGVSEVTVIFAVDVGVK